MALMPTPQGVLELNTIFLIRERSIKQLEIERKKIIEKLGE